MKTAHIVITLHEPENGDSIINYTASGGDELQSDQAKVLFDRLNNTIYDYFNKANELQASENYVK